MDPKKTARTTRGYWISIEQTEPSILMWVETDLLGLKERNRTSYKLSGLVIPNVAVRTEAERMIAHWAAGYGDPELVDAAVAAFRAVVDALPEEADETPGLASAEPTPPTDDLN
jgi:hypothetical protein